MSIEINELKQMLRHSAAVLILDNGEPSFVVLDYATYKRMLQENDATPAYNSAVPTKSVQSGESELLERINKDILALKEQIEEEEKNLGLQE
ncbi:MAG: hypothetical protein A3I39_00810 [Candidatus Yanofskybacteria bacterium RIFCSPLOWO2_02_FULL_47_9b]|uniref:Antitoxin n=1 Tax=Candidatus Yanofskybacteria bacterium RIFCSPLOWO2_02_FULL_47_9b TaxID=1802708 RepID=A0A1F8H616_9BACT|nr:MAG: hypothetical protein A3I39_00810 [Candidatus Yanofskybacteria bacterium RIFCSPLOWO2_02_FULL_47_9b]